MTDDAREKLRLLRRTKRLFSLGRRQGDARLTLDNLALWRCPSCGHAMCFCNASIKGLPNPGEPSPCLRCGKQAVPRDHVGEMPEAMRADWAKILGTPCSRHG